MAVLLKDVSILSVRGPFSGKLMDSEDDFLFQQMQQNYPAAVTCAEKIRTFILRKYGVFLPNEETAYLALHVARLTNGK